VSKFPKFVQLGKLDSVDEFAGEGVVEDRLVGAGRVNPVPVSERLGEYRDDAASVDVTPYSHTSGRSTRSVG
jgi:hypothetical protein